MGFADFLRTVFHSINPNSFPNLSTRSFKESFEYFLSILFVSFVVMVLLLIPTLMMIPKNIESTLNDFSLLSADIDLETTKAIEIPTKKPYIVIDTTGTYENVTTEKVLVTRDSVYSKNGLCFWFEPACSFYSQENRVKQTSLSDYSDLKTHSRTISQLTTTMLMFAAPTFIIFLYFLLALKYFIIIFLVALFAFGFAKLIRKDTTFTRLFKIGMYAGSIMIIMEVALLPFKIKLFMIPFFVFLILMLIGTYLLTEEEAMRADIDVLKSRPEPKPAKAEDEYVDLSKSKLKKLK